MRNLRSITDATSSADELTGCGREPGRTITGITELQRWAPRRLESHRQESSSSHCDGTNCARVSAGRSSDRKANAASRRRRGHGHRRRACELLDEVDTSTPLCREDHWFAWQVAALLSHEKKCGTTLMRIVPRADETHAGALRRLFVRQVAAIRSRTPESLHDDNVTKGCRWRASSSPSESSRFCFQVYSLNTYMAHESVQRAAHCSPVSNTHIQEQVRRLNQVQRLD